MKSIELNKNNPIVARFIPNTKSRRPVKVFATTSHHVSDYWDGGSRDYTYFYSLNGSVLSDDHIHFQRQTEGNPFGQRIGTVAINPGMIVVVNVIFQGKDLGYKIYVHPQDYTLFEKSVSNT